MGITGLIPFLDKASRRANVGEFSGCTVAIDSYCWLHKGAFACAEKLVRGEDTDVYVKYCMKYVNMLLSKNIKPILVFDGRHLPAKALTEEKRRESRQTSRKRAAELLSLGQTEAARSYLRRSVDVTHDMALNLIRACRSRNVDCIVAPYEADAQLAYLNINNYAQLVITEDSDLILFGCTKVLFKMDLEGSGTLVESSKLPLVMGGNGFGPGAGGGAELTARFRRMCVLSGCDYLPSLPGVGLAKARQFVMANTDSDFVNALKRLPSFLNKPNLVVSEEYRAGFRRAEATFLHQYVFQPTDRCMTRLTPIHDHEMEEWCDNAGSMLEDEIALQLAVGNLQPLTLHVADHWHPDRREKNNNKKSSSSWGESVASHPSIWDSNYVHYLKEERPWAKKKKEEPVLITRHTRPVKKVVHMTSKYVPETQDQSLTIETLSKMYCVEPSSKKQKTVHETQMDSQEEESKHEIAQTDNDIINEMYTQKPSSPILENKQRSYKKQLNKNSSYSVLKRLSKFPRTVIENSNIVESKFFSSGLTDSSDIQESNVTIEESPDKCTKNPFGIDKSDNLDKNIELDTQCSVIMDTQEMELSNSQKENSPQNSPVKLKSPVLETSMRVKNPFRKRDVEVSPTSVTELSQDSIIDNTYPLENLVTPVDSQESFGAESVQSTSGWRSSTDITVKTSSHVQMTSSSQHVTRMTTHVSKSRSNCKVPGLKRTASLPSNQPTLLSMFGFQKKSAMKR